MKFITENEIYTCYLQQIQIIQYCCDQSILLYLSRTVLTL